LRWTTFASWARVRATTAMSSPNALAISCSTARETCAAVFALETTTLPLWT
jgi:hypothetical protein